MEAMTSCPYTYEAMCSTLYSSPAPPDLIYFLEMFILPMFADLPLDTVAQMKQLLDKTLALIYLALTLTLQFAAIEALAFEGHVAAEREAASTLTTSKVQRTSTPSKPRQTTTRTRPALAVLAPKSISYSSQTSLDSLFDSPTSRSSSFSSQSSYITQSPDDASRSSSYSAHSSLCSSIIDAPTSPLSKPSPHTSQPCAHSFRRGIQSMPLTLTPASSRHNQSTQSQPTSSTPATTPNIAKVNTWSNNIIIPDNKLSPDLASLNKHNPPTSRAAVKQASTPFPSRTSSIRRPSSLLSQIKDRIQFATAGNAPIPSRPQSSKLPSHHINTSITSPKLLPLCQTRRDGESATLPLPQKSTRKRLAAATRHIFARRKSGGAPLGFGEQGTQHEKRYCYRALAP